MTALEEIRASWDQAARENAIGNILTIPGIDRDEFFRHGWREIEALREPLGPLGIPLGRALDFGCGIGRLSVALARFFAHVDGVDISGEMIARAEPHPDVTYHRADDLAAFADASFDFVYSMIVLQHMPQEMQHGYISEFFRVLKPGGVAMFHTPEGPDSGHPGWHLSMFGVLRETVGEWIAGSGGTLIDVEDLGVDSGWRNLRYTAVRA
jgi:2-polyprenyl-3-methyl-5-hydroxy-6-metoxy-1,4-benzoquinol methylase